MSRTHLLFLLESGSRISAGEEVKGQTGKCTANAGGGVRPPESQVTFSHTTAPPVGPSPPGDTPRAAGIASWSQRGRVPRFPELSADEAPLGAG